LLAQGLGIAAAEAADFRLLRLDGHFVKWGAASWASGAQVTYAFVRKEMAFADAVNCKVLVPLDALQEKANIPAASFEAAVAAAFRQWSAVVNVSFLRSDEPETAQLLIGAQKRQRGIAYTNLWHGSQEGADISPITRASICLNPDRDWQLESDGDKNTYEVDRVMAHEIGHAIGLNHSGPSGQLMAFRYSETDAGLGAGDVAGALLLYGDPPAAE